MFGRRRCLVRLVRTVAQPQLPQRQQQCGFISLLQLRRQRVHPVHPLHRFAMAPSASSQLLSASLPSVSYFCSTASSSGTAVKLESGGKKSHGGGAGGGDRQQKYSKNKRRFVSRFRRKILGFLVLNALFWYFIDADFPLFVCDLYRRKISTNKLGMEGKNVWIIGASSGMGEHLVYQLVENGANKIIISSRRENQLRRVKANCVQLMQQSQQSNGNDRPADHNAQIPKTNALRSEIVIAPLDILDFIDTGDDNDNYGELYVQQLMDVFAADIDILVINAGRRQKALALENNAELMSHLMDLNVFGPIAVSQCMAKYWKKMNAMDGRLNRKSKKLHQIAITSSIAGKIASPNSSAYAMTKHAINGYMESFRVELTHDKIDVNVVCPGFIDFTEHSLPDLSADMHTERGVADGRGAFQSSSMSVQRCAQLYTTALQYSLSECWISKNPVLLLAYYAQYLPIIMGPVSRGISILTNAEAKKMKLQK